MKQPTTPQHLFLVDGSGFIFRAFHALPPMTREDGTPVNAVFGYTKMLMKLIEDTEADHIAVIFDRARKTFRSEIYPKYKANRPPPPEELIPQFELVRDATKALNLPAVDMDGYEADDLIATYARQAAERNIEVTIVSSDKDLMQLVNSKITMLDAMKNRVITREQVMEKFGVGPERVIDVQALAGDSSDNVPGVEGIGVKTAAQLIIEYGDLDTLLKRADEIKQPKRREKLITQADMARISRDLVRLRDDVPIDKSIDDFAVRPPDSDVLLNFLKEQGFKSLVTSVAARLGEDDKSNYHGSVVPGTANYELIQDVENLKKWIVRMENAGSFAIDTETTGLDSMQAELVGLSISIEPGQACYIPLAHKVSGAEKTGDLLDSTQIKSTPDQVPFDQSLKLLAPLLEDRSVLKIGQNLKYDMQVLARYGLQIFSYDDTMLLSYVLDGGLHGHGLDELARDQLGIETIKFKDVVGTGKNQITFDFVPLDEARDYAAEDADITLRLHRLFRSRLVEEHMVTVYETLERPIISILEKMERTGVKVNAAELKQLSGDFSRRIAILEDQIYDLAGREFNVGSPKQLGEVLFDEMGLPSSKKSRTGAYATGADVLENLATEGYELPARILDWRQLSKLKSTYTDALISAINPATGRIHTSYAQAATTTGRLASSNPNLQNIPIRSEEGRKIRRAFVPEKGYVLMSADYSQIELRLLAHVANIETLKGAFKAGKDIHAITASQVFNQPVETMDPLTRRNAKAINFGIIYGISAFGLARQLGISNSDAKDYIEAYFSKYPGIRAYMEKTKAQAKKQGYVETLFGRKCHMRGITDRNPNVRGFAERAAINAPIQGGAADIIKRAMIRLPDAIKNAGLKARMLLQVHDELVFEVPEKELDQTKALIKEIMEGAAHLDVPLVVDIGHGYNWEEAH